MQWDTGRGGGAFTFLPKKHSTLSSPSCALSLSQWDTEGKGLCVFLGSGWESQQRGEEAQKSPGAKWWHPTLQHTLLAGLPPARTYLGIATGAPSSRCYSGGWDAQVACLGPRRAFHWALACGNLNFPHKARCLEIYWEYLLYCSPI